MRRHLILAAGAWAATSALCQAHGLSPGRQTVHTMGERALVRLEASNGRPDISTFEVELFEAARWTPSRVAVASVARFTVPAPPPGSFESTNRVFTVLVDLDGKREQPLRVCTKSLAARNLLRPQTTGLVSRVCVNVLVRKFQP